MMNGQTGVALAVVAVAALLLLRSALRKKQGGAACGGCGAVQSRKRGIRSLTGSSRRRM